LNADLQLALALADVADAITMKFFRSSALSIRTKSDRTPVSEADEATERALRDRLQRDRPDDGIVGEEFGTTGRTDRRWILDPIDGTKNYVRGVPVWGTLIALEENGRLTTGVVAAPALHRRWWASAGGGAFCNGARLSVSRVAALPEAIIGYDEIADFDARGLTEKFTTLMRRCGRSRAFGDFWIHMLVAEGAMDIAVEPQVALWDMAPVQLIVEEAGGRFTSLSGEPRADGGSSVSTNGFLHDLVLDALR
jgi:histidinol-phosphatase